MINQKGYIALPLIIFALIAAFLVIPRKFPAQKIVIQPPVNKDCPERPDGSKTLQINGITYKQFRKNLNITKIAKKELLETGQSIEYFNGDGHHTVSSGTIEDKGIKYAVYLGGTNGELDINDPGSPEFKLLVFNNYKVAWLVHLDSNDQPITSSVLGEGGRTWEYYKVDLYQEELDINSHPMPNNVFCSDGSINADVTPLTLVTSSSPATVSASPVVDIPEQNISSDNKQLQLRWFLFRTRSPSEESRVLFYPHCKPAIYLYPKNKTFVNVKVYPRGNFTFTDPVYDLNRGWDVWAEPNGQLEISNFKYPMSNFKYYPYLYYEAQIKDEFIEKPEEGYVVRKDEIPELLSRIMPKLGLNTTETKQFKEYWERVLPESSYYFIGIMDPSNLDYIEPLEITPKPDSVIRVSLYFEPLEQFKTVSEPNIVTPVRSGFSVVEWGGLIKLHKDTPFTCSQ